MRSALALVLCISSLAAATPDPLGRARAALATGTQAFKAGDFHRALAAFREAEPQAALLGALARVRWNIARSLEEMGRLEEALRAFEACLEVAPTAERRRQVLAKIRAMEIGAFGVVTVRCDAAGIEVRLGEGPRAPCPTSWRRVPVGAQTVRAERAGRAYRPIGLEVIGGRVSAVTIPAPGRLRVDGVEPGAAVRLDDAEIGRGPTALDGLPPGRYHLTVGEGFVTTVGIRAGAEVRVEVPPRGARLAPWLAAGAGLAFAGAGAWALFEAEDAATRRGAALAEYAAAREAATVSRWRARAEAANEDEARWRALGWTGVGLGAAALAGAAWLWASDAGPGPVATGRGPGLGWRATW